MHKNSSNISKADAYRKDASHEKDRADKLMQTQDWNGSIEASQHSIEHSIKSLFLLVGLQHPFEHDPTAEFDAVFERLQNMIKDPYYLNWVDLARVRWVAKVWATMHEESMYPFHNIPAKEFFVKKDADILKDYAEEVYRICSNVLFLIQAINA